MFLKLNYQKNKIGGKKRFFASPKIFKGLLNVIYQEEKPAKKHYLYGFTLVECLLSLSLSLIILVSATEILSRGKQIFSRLKEEHESILIAVTGLEKIREDLVKAGTGLNLDFEIQNLRPLVAQNSRLVIYSKEKKFKIQENIEPGANIIIVFPDSELSSSLRKGRQIVIKNRREGEFLSITAVSNNRLSVSPAISYTYGAQESEILLLEKVEIFLDEKQSILRRKVNDTSGQPLLEEVTQFETFYDQNKNLLTLNLMAGKLKERTYELFLFPKNLF